MVAILVFQSIMAAMLVFQTNPLGVKLRWPTRVTTHYLTTYFELLSTHFKLYTTHSKFLKTHSKFFETHFKFTTNSEIFATHFEIFTTHSPQDPKCWQRKRNGYTAPPSSFDAMFCSTYACGQQLQESVVFCPKCSVVMFNKCSLS